MYRIYANGQLLHYPLMATEGLVVISPVLREKLNTHGSLQFEIAPSNPLYDALEPRNTLIKVVSDTENNKPWFGRVMSIERGWKDLLTVYCEGEFGCMCDSVFIPFGFKGAPSALLTQLVNNYNSSRTNGYRFAVGNISVVDPNNTIVRSSSSAMTVWEAIEDKLFGSSLGGYVLPRYDAETDTHYIDYLALDDNDQFARTSSQTIEFGRNLLDFVQNLDGTGIVTVLIPYGSQTEETQEPPENGQWDGNRITIASVNGGKRYIENADGIARWGRVVGTKIWDDVTLPANLLTKATAWLSQQIWVSVALEISAVDLAFVDADIEQIQVGEYVRCKSKPHDLNVLLLCTEKETYLTELEQSAIILGAGMKTITDLQKGEQ